MSFRVVIFLLLALVQGTRGYIVKGRILCNGIPAPNQLAKLYHHVDDDMRKTQLDRDATNQRGVFELDSQMRRAPSDISVVMGELGCTGIVKVNIEGTVQRDSQVVDIGDQKFCCKGGNGGQPYDYARPHGDSRSGSGSGLSYPRDRSSSGSRGSGDWKFQAQGKIMCEGRPVSRVTVELHHKTHGQDAPPADKALRSVSTSYDGSYSVSSVSKPSYGTGMQIVIRAQSPNGRRQCWSTIGYDYRRKYNGIQDTGESEVCCKDEASSSRQSSRDGGSSRGSRPGSISSSHGGSRPGSPLNGPGSPLGSNRGSNSGSQYFGVKGQVTCNGSPLSDVKSTLYMRYVDPTRNAETEMNLGVTNTDSNGNFEVSGTPSVRLDPDGLKPFIELSQRKGSRICEKQLIFPANLVGGPTHEKSSPIDFCCS